MAATLDEVIAEIRRIQADARTQRLHRASRVADDRAAHAQGLDRPEGGRRQADRGLLALAPGADGRDAREPRARRILEDWMKSYRPEELFDADGRLRPELAELAPRGRAPHERQPARQRRPAAARPAAARLPRLCRRRSRRPARSTAEATRVMGKFLRDVMKLNLDGAQLPPLQPRREQLQPLAGRARGHQPRLGRRDLSLTTTTSPPTAA